MDSRINHQFMEFKVLLILRILLGIDNWLLLHRLILLVHFGCLEALAVLMIYGSIILASTNGLG